MRCFLADRPRLQETLADARRSTAEAQRDFEDAHREPQAAEAWNEQGFGVALKILSVFFQPIGNRC